MMSYKQWLVLLGMYVMFMLMGAVGFLYLEEDKELAERENLLALKQRVIETVSGLDNGSRGPVEDLMKAVGDECGHDFLKVIQDTPAKWNLWNAFFFTFTVTTTVGYGHLYPTTVGGRILCMFYTILGVPFNMILVITLAGFFSSMVLNCELRRHAWQYGSWVGAGAEAVLYLGPGVVVFLLVPAAVFNQLQEGWNYFDSFYYSFITITTVGFGERVAGMQEEGEVWLLVYKMLIVVWIFFGLGYDYMIVTLIQKGLRSKKVHNVERKLASALKRRTNRLTANVHRDLQHIRMALGTIGGVAEGVQTEVSKEFPKPGSRKFSLQVSPPPPPCSVSISRLHTLTRSVSEARLNNVCKARVEELESLSNINMLLDMVETMVLEHNAMAAQDMQEEFRHIVEEDDSSSADDGSESFGDCEKSLSTHDMPMTMVVRFLNKPDKPHTRDDTLCDEQIHFNLHESYPRKASLPESSQRPWTVKAPWGTAGEGEHVKIQPNSTSFLKSMRHMSHSLPGRVKAWTEETRPHFNSIFVHPKANLSLFSHWIHHTDEGSKDQHLNRTDQQKEKDEVNIEYIRL